VLLLIISLLTAERWNNRAGFGQKYSILCMQAQRRLYLVLTNMWSCVVYVWNLCLPGLITISGKRLK